MKRGGPAQKVVLARSKEGNGELKEKLSGLGVNATAVDTIKFDFPEDRDRMDAAIKRMPNYDWVAFTSQKGVDAFRERAAELGVDIDGPGPKFAAVGPATAAALEEMGVRVAYVPKDYLTSALGGGLPTDSGRKVLLLRSDAGAKSLVERLGERGFEVDDVPAYRTLPLSARLDPRAVDGASFVVFASPSEVSGFQALLGQDELDKVAKKATAACIGPVTAEAARDAGFRSVVFPEEHTVDALAAKVRELVTGD